MRAFGTNKTGSTSIHPIKIKERSCRSIELRCSCVKVDIVAYRAC
jgi:hypothetical protein